MGTEELMNVFIPDKQLLEEALAAPTIVVEPPPPIVLPQGMHLKQPLQNPD